MLTGLKVLVIGGLAAPSLVKTLLRQVEQKAEGRGGVLYASAFLGDGEGVEEAVVLGVAVDPGGLAEALLEDLFEEFLGPQVYHTPD